MYRAAQMLRHARRRVLDFGRSCPAFAAFAQVQAHRVHAGQSP
jgi:hypothetical protein